MAQADQRGLELFAQGRYQEAIGSFEESLRQAETSEVWSDWATAQFASGRVPQAREGLKRALQLNPQNHQAAANLRLVELLADSAQKCAGGSQQGILSNDSLLRKFLQDIQAIPGEDPSLPPKVIAAIRTTRLDSGYFVGKCLERLAKLPPEILPPALACLERWAEAECRLAIVLGCLYLRAKEYERAGRLLRFACERNPLDLFAENALIACHHQRAAETGATSEFEGLEAYLAGSFCEVPWRHLEIAWDGNTFLCCPAWLPLCVGNARDQSLEEIWNSDLAMAIRKSILDGSFRFCSKFHCVSIAARTLPRRPSSVPGGESALNSALAPSSEFPLRVPGGPRKLVLSYDRTCNLACPQCRSEFHVAGREEQESMERDYSPGILRTLRHAETLYLNGAGEAFVGRHSRRLLSLVKREQFPQLKLHFISNGQLLNERAFHEFDLWGRIHSIQISMDAARPETYRLVRRGGNFQRLLSNLAFLDELRRTREEKFRFVLSFVVSSLNFREIPEFVQLGNRFHVDSVIFTLFRNWGQLPRGEFEKLNVVNPDHPEHREFLRVLESPELSDPIVDCGSMAPYRHPPERRDE